MRPEGAQVVEDFVPTPIFSGQVQFNTPNAISFAPAATRFGTPTPYGTLMADFSTSPRALRDWDDLLSTKSFTQLVITWPGFKGEWKTSMKDIVDGKDYVSRAELARFVMDKFSTFTNKMGACSWSHPEWGLDEYNIRNTCLAFLWSPAPGVWQPAFRVRNQPRDIKGEPLIL